MAHRPNKIIPMEALHIKLNFIVRLRIDDGDHVCAPHCDVLLRGVLK